ncbi:MULTISPECIES: protein kinase domain-containing protein [unclassified Luteimonas]
MQEQGDAGQPVKAYCWSFGNAEFDESRWQLRVADNAVELERKPLEVLQYLLRHAGEAVTKEELLGAVWAGRIVVEAVLTNAVGKLRKALRDDAQEFVTTLPRVGYRLSVPVSRRVVEFLPEASRLQEGDAVPRRPNWRLEAPLARTEGNEVWLARHAKTREERVFKFSLAGKGLAGLKREVTIARLLREALGKRDDFIRVLDWDFEEAPYFVESEYGGTSLDQWQGLQEAAPAARERRLGLFVSATDAVAAAHGIGVLHKDIKPANLLVQDGPEGTKLRVADFGSSRLFDSSRLDELGITHLGLTRTQAISSESGTPLYLAPEVATGQSATIRSDVYALGVTLYQLLVGDFRRPMAPGWERDIDDPLLREDIAAAAHGNPERRLDSAAALADRVRNLAARREKRELELAVRARVEEGEKRLARMRARRPWMIAAMVALLAGTTGSLLLAQRAHRAEQRAQEEAARAQASLRTQAMLNDFLSEDVIGAAAPDRNSGHQPTVLEALDSAASGIGERFKDDAGSAGTMHLVLAGAYQAVAQVEKAEAQYALAATHLEQAFGIHDARGSEARLGRSHMLLELGRFDEARVQLDTAASQLAGMADATVSQRYRLGHTRAYLHERQADYKTAAAEYRKLVELGEQESELGRDLLLKSRAELGFALLATGEAVEAERELSEALAGLEQINGRLHSQTIQARQNLVQALMQVGRRVEALKQIDMLEADLVQVLGTSHPQLGNVHTLRAISLVAEEQFAEAADEYGKASRLFAETLGEDSPFTLSTLQYRGEALRWAGRSADAAQALSARLADAHRVFQDPSPAFAEFSIILAMAYLDLHDEERAHALLQGIHADDGKIALDANSQRRPYLRLLEGRISELRGDRGTALAKYRDALEALPKDSDYSREVRLRLSAVEDAG